MPVNVLMPQLGESVFEGTLSRWLKEEGQAVAEFEPLAEVNTDKVDTEIPAPAAGILLKRLAAEGSLVRVGDVLAVVSAADDAPDAPPVPARRELGFISPVVARLADEHGLDLRQIPGTGQNGRITKNDVLAYLAAAAPASPLATPAPLLPAPAAARAEPATASADFIPVTGMRRSIAEHMVRSEHTAPHVTTVFEVDLTRVLAHRAAHKAQFARDGADLTLTAYFVLASVAGLKAVPIVNSQWAEDKIILKREINIGMAVALDEGLIVPVIKHADGQSLLGLARAVNDLAARARAKALRPEEAAGGTFTLTNHGVTGSLFALPIINQPQSAILGVGAMQKRAVVINDAIAIRPMAYLSLTFDHRVLDGAVGDRFLAEVKRVLEGIE